MLNICKTKSICVRKISNRWLITFCHRIDIITNHVSFFFLVMTSKKSSQKFWRKFIFANYFVRTRVRKGRHVCDTYLRESRGGWDCMGSGPAFKNSNFLNLHSNNSKNRHWTPNRQTKIVLYTPPTPPSGFFGSAHVM